MQVSISDSFVIQVAFGVDLKDMASEVTQLQSFDNALRELMGHLENTLEGIEYSFYFFLFQVCVKIHSGTLHVASS